MMKVELYEEAKHYALLASWAEKYGRTPTPKHLIPTIGYVVGEIAAGFLYRTDTTLALIENLSADPDRDVGIRSDALDQVVEEILKTAWSLGFLSVAGTTHLKAIEERARKHGFTIYEKPVTLVVRHRREGE